MVLSVSFVKVGSALSSPVAIVSGTLGPNGDTKDYSFTLAEDLSDSLIHVVVNAAAPDSDRLSDISIDGHSCCYEVQGDWWGSAADTFGPLTAGQHNITATTSLDAANQVAFVVELYEIPAPPFTIAGTFPPLSIAYNNFVRFEFNVRTPGDYLLSATASAGNFAITEVGDEIDVSGPTQRTLQFTEARTYGVTVQPDIFGTDKATKWSITISPMTATTTSSTTSTSSSTTSTLTETTSPTSSSMTSTISTETSSSVSSTATTTVTESSALSETTRSTSSAMTSAMSSSMSAYTSATTSGSQQANTSTPPPKCVIATAAYGSEMAPEVVYMRFVRDELIGSSYAGRILVAAFNVFYYSWSPSLAREIAASQLLRAIFRVLLLPLVQIVHATALAFTALAGITGNTNLASVLAFLLAALMAVSVYITFPALAVTKLERRVRRLAALGRKQARVGCEEEKNRRPKHMSP